MDRSGFTILCAVLVSLCFVLPASSGPTSIKPFIALEQEYNDNIFFSNSSEDEDFITTVSGGLRIDQNTERVNATLDARLYHLWYWDFDDLDSLDGAANGDFHYRVTEKLGVGGSAEYSEDSRRDRDTTTTGLVVAGDRETKRASLSTDYWFSEITNGKVALGYGNIEIEDVNTDEDNDEYRVDLLFARNLSRISENTTGMINFNYLRYDADIESTNSGPPITTFVQDNTSDVFQLTAGLSKDITELYNVYLHAGVSYTDTTEKLRTTVLSVVTDSEEDSSKWGWVLSTGVNYKGEYFDARISASRDVRGAVSTNGVVERSMISANVQRKISEKFVMTLDASVFYNENDRRLRSDTEELTFNIQPGFRYRILKGLTLSCNYKFTSIENRRTSTTSERNMVFFVLQKEFEL